MTTPHRTGSRHWFVTGATGGLGRAIVEHALRSGDVVTATARRGDALHGLRQRFGDALTVEELDLSSSSGIDDVVDRTVAARPVDVVVNNAGYAVVGAVEEMSVEQIRDQIEVLLIAPILITRAFLEPMRERGGGHIVQISSLGGQTGVPTHSCYHAGKWGLEGFTESVAREVAEFGVRLTLVEPGGTRTNFLSGMQFTTESEPYRRGAVGETRRALQQMDPASLTGDPAKIAALVDEVTRQSDPPLRLAVGLDSYEAIDTALAARLAALRSQRDVAASVQIDD